MVWPWVVPNLEESRGVVDGTLPDVAAAFPTLRAVLAVLALPASDEYAALTTRWNAPPVAP